MHYTDARHGYGTKGQVFIHELVHAWQIQTKSFRLGVLCKAVLETGSYTYGLSGQAWSDFGLEQQAAIVDQWFGMYAGMWNTIEDVIANLAAPNAIHDPRFGYIANNIQLGEN